MLLAIGAALSVSAQQHYYYYKGEKIMMELNPEYIFVSSPNEDNIKDLNTNFTVNTSIVSEVKKETISQTLNKPEGTSEVPTRYWREIKLNDNFTPANYLSEVQQMQLNNNDIIVAPYFKTASTEKLGLSNYFYVRLKDQNDFSVLQDMIEQHNVELIGQNKFRPLSYILSVTSNSLNAVQMAIIFHESNLFEHAGPDLMFDFKLSSNINSSNSVAIPNDTFYPDQWCFNNTGQDDGRAGIDIKAEDAWDITTGHNGISTAVIDEGVELDHPDLINNIIGNGFDPISGTSPAQVYGPHGTACASLVAGEGNNNEGISGVAPNSKIIPISIDFNVGTLQTFADAIDWAWRNGADVISNSWGIVGAGVPSTMEIDIAINNALTNGRNGLGTVVVFSSGNDNIDGAQYPSNTNPDILCIGAIDRCGIRSGRADIVANSCEPWCATCRPGSSFGNPLDVVAGGTSISSADRQGDVTDVRPDFGDYNPDSFSAADNYDNFDYTNGFGGTSAACPIAAGVVALVLSVNPALTVQQVNTIIEQSAQKIRTDEHDYATTANRPNGTWNNEVGYGLVDAHQAILLAQQLLVCEENITVEANANNNSSLLSIYASSNKISTEQTASDDADVIINSTEVVDFKSDHIQLNAGFKVNTGACFNGLIDPCEN